MNPPELLINSGTCFIKMSKLSSNHMLLDSVNNVSKLVCTALNYIADTASGDWNTKYARKDFMCTFYTYSPHSIHGDNERL